MHPAVRVEEVDVGRQVLLLDAWAPPGLRCIRHGIVFVMASLSWPHPPVVRSISIQGRTTAKHKASVHCDLVRHPPCKAYEALLLLSCTHCLRDVGVQGAQVQAEKKDEQRDAQISALEQDRANLAAEVAE